MSRCPSWKRTVPFLALGAVLTMPGCRLVPVRRGEPPLEPLERPADGRATTSFSAPSEPGALPPLPPNLVPFTEREVQALAARPATTATPLLDAALDRTRFEGEPAPVGVAARPAEPTSPGRGPISVSIRTEEPATPASLVAPPAEIEPLVPPADAHVRLAGPVEPDPWVAGIEGLKTMARDRADRSGDDRPVWLARERLLESLAGHAPNPGGHPLWDIVLTSLAGSEGPPGEAEPVAEAVSELAATGDGATQVPGPAILDIALCRRVGGFADFDPLDAGALRAGQPVLLYCQIDGLRYEAAGTGTDDRYRSVLASRVELLREGQDEPIWTQDFDPAEDRCRRPRHDYFASYRLSLPKTMAPGTYRLRLIQTDTLADRTVHRDLALTIRR